MHKRYIRWSADTETAFVLALRQTGQVRLAATAVGRSVAGAYRRRAGSASFAARWELAVAEHRLDAVPPEERRGAAGSVAWPVAAPETRERFDGWTPVRRRAFLRALSETGTVKAACERVKISDRSVYRLRAASTDFARDMAAALERSTPMLEQVAWERAVEGWDEPIVMRGEVVGTRRRYSETLLRTLLSREWAACVAERKAAAHEAARAPAAEPMFAESSETDATLNALLDKLAHKRRAQLLAAAEAWEAYQRRVYAGDGDGWVRTPR
ncbi:hypothetical protein [Sphingomonas sp.]|uniref:hypothetical protein n=1 Tax=Sphingomonas sp. TaxID=28214 RepID=UPI001EB8ACDF|nr:hypothetical protein [Sphingomonas sp.]MBX3592926.1 hypothetical protein [Sphingomonas sp.]